MRKLLNFSTFSDRVIIIAYLGIKPCNIFSMKQEPEEEESFVVELVSVQNDAELDPEASVATVTVEPSDFVRGLVEFTDESR